MTQEQFIEKARIKHGDKYDYSKVVYENSQKKVCIICPKHGEFWQVPSAHIRGDNCPKCGNEVRGRFEKLTLEQFVEKSKEIHGDKYDYSKVNYKNSSTKIEIICKEHGSFFMTPLAHIYGNQGCPKCAGRNLTTDEIIEKFKTVHGNKYDYSKVVYTKMHEKVCIICPIHGEFWQTPSKHLLGQCCPKCSIAQRSKNKTLTTEEFIKKAKEVHGDKYDYSNVEYTGTYNEVSIICPKHGIFFQRANDHLNGHGCHHCGNIISKFEDEINDYINSLGFETLRNVRNIIGENLEIDIFIPNLNIGIECDGLKWHSDEFKNDKYHLNKTNLATHKGIHLIQIFEDEWMFKKDIIKNILKTILSTTENKIFARKCGIKEISNSEVKDFVDTNHLQGHINALVNIVLIHNNEIVSLMSFGKKRINLGHKKNVDGEYELLRYCVKSDYQIIGGAKRLFSYFLKHYVPSEIVSYCDRRYFKGDLYYNLGFTLDHISKPNYYYVIGNNKFNRYKYRKSELVKMGFDKNKTEKEIMLEQKIHRIYDCGNYVFKYLNKKE